MASFLAVTALSFLTLYLGTYVADRVDRASGKIVLEGPNRRADE